jgi:predicted nucleic acid-binding protein
MPWRCIGSCTWIQRQLSILLKIILITLKKMQILFDLVDERKITVVTSSFTRTETLSKPIRDKATEVEKQYRLIFDRGEHLETIPLDDDIANDAAQLRAAYNLRSPDAVHLATAIKSNCQAFLTNDLQLKRVTEIPILVLDELEFDLPPDQA